MPKEYMFFLHFSSLAAYLTINPNPGGWGIYDFQNFEQVLLNNALNKQKF